MAWYTITALKVYRVRNAQISVVSQTFFLSSF